MIMLTMTADVPATAPFEKAPETTAQFLAECDRELTDCYGYLNSFILGAMENSSQRDLKCIPLGRNVAAEKMLSLMRDPELADWDSNDGLMESLTGAFPCLTGH